MDWREQISRLRHWSGWRRHAPAGASVFAHLVVVGALANLMASAVSPAPRRPPEMVLSVDFVPTIPDPASRAGVTPPPMKAPAPRERSTPPVSPTGPVLPAPTSPQPGAQPNDDDAVYLGPPQVLTNPGLSKGLAGLMGDDPCAVKYGPKAKECAGRDLAARTGKMDSTMPRTKQELAQHFGEFMPTCRYRTGCEGGEWISTNGTRSVGKPPPGSSADRGVGTPGAGGAASLGGLHTSVGRLGFNPDHTDPGFGD